MTENRKDILLRAAYDLLRRAGDSPFVLEANCILTQYDGTNCDGACLMADIASELGLVDDHVEPKPLLPGD
jgi:hypothetical protein